jgi:hypothetical protein
MLQTSISSHTLLNPAPEALNPKPETRNVDVDFELHALGHGNFERRQVHATPGSARESQRERELARDRER